MGESSRFHKSCQYEHSTLTHGVLWIVFLPLVFHAIFLRPFFSPLVGDAPGNPWLRSGFRRVPGEQQLLRYSLRVVTRWM